MSGIEKKKLDTRGLEPLALSLRRTRDTTYTKCPCVGVNESQCTSVFDKNVYLVSLIRHLQELAAYSHNYMNRVRAGQIYRSKEAEQVAPTQC